MLEIRGKSLITTDWHFGLKSNSENRLKILVSVTREVSSYLKENGIDNVIFTGDLFHSRSNLAINTINVAIKCVEAISRNCKNVYLILGNHDIFNKNSVEINSVNMFKHIRNVHIIQHSTECDINGKHCIFVPWLGVLDEYENSTFDMAFGHFDISYKYMINAFLEENISKGAAESELKMLIESDEMLKDAGFEDFSEECVSEDETYLKREKSSSLIGNWIEKVKRGGTIFAGHIHNHREFRSKGRKFIFIGSPYQTNRGEMRSVDGFYSMDENGEYEFHELKGIPRFVDIRISEILKKGDSYDFETVRGNIIHKIYDCEIDRVEESRINHRIYECKPFEELEPDYMVTFNAEGEVSESLEVIRKSKLEYLQLYINNIDSRIFEKEGLDKEKLMETTKEYYGKVGER